MPFREVTIDQVKRSNRSVKLAIAYLDLAMSMINQSIPVEILAACLMSVANGGKML